MKNKLLIAAVIAVIAGISWWLLYYFSDKEVIKRQFIAISKALGKAGEETPMITAMKMKPVMEFLAQECEVVVPERNFLEIMEPGLAVRYIIMYRNRHATLLVAINDFTVNTPSKGQAEVNARLHLTGNSSQADIVEEMHMVEFSLQKMEKKWMIHKVTLPEALVQ